MNEFIQNTKLKLKLLKDYFYYGLISLFERDKFKDVESFCLFIGYPRSGHTLVSSLLDAHENVIIANEQHVLQYVRAHFKKYQIFSMLLHNSQNFTKKGRSWTSYNYAIEGLYQGRFSTLKVIGDKRGGDAIKLLRRDISLIEKLQKVVNKPVKMIHVIRNPYDNISTMSRKHNITLDHAIEDYFSRVQTVLQVKEYYKDYEIFEMKHEDLIKDPIKKLKELCTFFNIHCDEQYLTACSKLVFNNPRKSRSLVNWEQKQIEEVERRMLEIDFLKDYTFDE